jgi:hypothetical protein
MTEAISFIVNSVYIILHFWWLFLLIPLVNEVMISVGRRKQRKRLESYEYLDRELWEWENFYEN